MRGKKLCSSEKSLLEKAGADHDAVGVFIISRLIRGGTLFEEKSSAHRRNIFSKKTVLTMMQSRCLLLVDW